MPRAFDSGVNRRCSRAPDLNAVGHRGLATHMRDRERGDTYIELLIATVIIAFAATAILSALTTSIANSAEHRSLSVDETLVKSYLETTKEVLEAQSSPAFSPNCPMASSYESNATLVAWRSANVPNGYTVEIESVQYWNGSGFVSGCTLNSYPNDGIQLITVRASNNSTSTTLSTAVRDPCYEDVTHSTRTAC